MHVATSDVMSADQALILGDTMRDSELNAENQSEQDQEAKNTVRIIALSYPLLKPTSLSRSNQDNLSKSIPNKKLEDQVGIEIVLKPQG
jgi:hypothetical protein